MEKSINWTLKRIIYKFETKDELQRFIDKMNIIENMKG
jgi:hypothetical protein